MLVVYAAAVTAYVLFRLSVGEQPVSEDMKMTVTMASVCLKLLTACILVYLAMLILRESQDRAWEKKQNPTKKTQTISGTLLMNLISFILVSGTYIILRLTGIFT